MIYSFLLETWLTNRNSRYKWKIVEWKLKWKLGKCRNVLEIIDRVCTAQGADEHSSPRKIALIQESGRHHLSEPRWTRSSLWLWWMVRGRPSQSISRCPVCNQVTQQTWPMMTWRPVCNQPHRGGTNRLHQMDGILRLYCDRNEARATRQTT